MKRLEEALAGREDSYILPFLWMKGESRPVIREELDRIQECGIREICLESRPHPDFLGDSWWMDLDCIMEEARKRSMRVWVLDDRKFPTGYANGAFVRKYPQLAKVYLAERHMDVVGPASQNAVLIQPFLGGDGKLLAVLAVERADGGTTALRRESALDLTDQVRDGFLYLDIPEGQWRIMVLYTTQKGGGREGYMNLIDSASVRVLLDEVYEPHYERYRQDFGKTFAGFFSDEPELGNVAGYGFQEKLGQGGVRLPWSKELRERLQKSWGDDWKLELVSLWYETGEGTGAARADYMDAVTLLVKQCFSGQIGAWCEERGVEYIGHVIEDDNAHARLGCGAGHYFREQSAQHRSGIDVVHFQIVPGFDDPVHQWIAGDRDGEFFHYGLAKLGASAAHLDTNKKGRALCEIFGNYGWAFGTAGMKWLADHMLVRGINHFVPHAFSMQYPDPDCPPHFYARGHNPEFPLFAELMRYLNRMCHLLSGGIHIADAAILYHAESEWSGGETMLFQKPGRRLMEHQLDYDVVSVDKLEEGTADHGRLRIGEETYACLILPYSERIPDRAAARVIELAKGGVEIFVMDSLPQQTMGGSKLTDEFRSSVCVVSLERLTEKIPAGIWTEGSFPHLRLYRYKQKDGLILMVMNESNSRPVETMLHLPGNACGVREYDGMKNSSVFWKTGADGFSLLLEPGQSRLLILTEEEGGQPQTHRTAARPLCSEWKISVKEEGQKWTLWRELAFGAKLPNINGPDCLPDFCGTIRYETEMWFENVTGRQILYLPEFGDSAQIWVNEKNPVTLLRSPARADVTEDLITGHNRLRIEITNTPVWKVKDPVSTHLQIGPTGMTQTPVLECWKPVM